MHRASLIEIFNSPKDHRVIAGPDHELPFQAVAAGEMSAGRCQRKANQSAQPRNRYISGRKFTPLGKGGGAIEFEVFAVVEVAFLVEVVVD